MTSSIRRLIRYGLLCCIGMGISLALNAIPAIAQIHDSVPASMHTASDAQLPSEHQITAQSAESLVAEGHLFYEQGRWDAAIASWNHATRLYQDMNNDAGVTGTRMNQAKAMEMSGHYRQACETALLAIGIENQPCEFHTSAQIESVVNAIEGESDLSMQLLEFTTLGNVLRLNGYLPQAQQLLEAAVTIAQGNSQGSINPTHSLPNGHIVALLNLGKVEQAQYQRMLQRYQQTQRSEDQERALEMSLRAFRTHQTANDALIVQPDDSLLRIQVSAQFIDLLTTLQQSSPIVSRQLSSEQQENAIKPLPFIQQQIQVMQALPLDAMPPSRTLIDSQISVAQNLLVLWQKKDLRPALSLSPTTTILPLLNRSQSMAIALQDTVAQSQALGTLGHFYEVLGVDSRQPATSFAYKNEAKHLTQSALTLAQSVQASHLAYQWQWQLGRLYRHDPANEVSNSASEQASERASEQAIAYYQTAVDTLGDVRRDLLALNQDVRFDLRDAVEPLYREFVALLLEDSDGDSPPQPKLRQAIREIDALQLSRLEDFLSCNLTQQIALDDEQSDPNAAIIYSIILPDRLAVVVQFPQTNDLQFYQTMLPEAEILQTLRNLRQESSRPFLTQPFFEQAQQVYDWLIRPIEVILEAQSINTLVFVSDGAVRNVPMAVLHDGQQFLVEKYALALSPSLQLPISQPLTEKSLEVLSFGLSTTRSDFLPHEGFAPLENVELELDIIQDQLPSQNRLNHQFTGNTLQDLVKINDAPVLHLATHGQFSSNPDDTFLLAWDQRITLTELSQVLGRRTDQDAIELLVLSACQTASGDDRATLGLAGIAIQSGARSTIASLWSVDDIATAELMGNLYQTLATSTNTKTRAQALQQAQLALLNTSSFRAPIYWSAFVLIGNWD